VHEFLGTLAYESRSGAKVVHYWRMAAGQTPTRKLMRDVRAVDWLPIGEAVERLSRGHERAFLQQVGPIALAAANGLGHADASVDRPAEPRRVEASDDVQPWPHRLMQRIRGWLRRAA